MSPNHLPQPSEAPRARGPATGTPGERTLEVLAMYGKTPQRVLHLGKPSAGHTRPSSVAMLTLGLLLLVGGACSFGYQMHRIRRETRHRASVMEFIKERGLPERYAPQVTAHPEVEAASAAAFVAGMFLLLFGGLRLREEQQRPSFRIGEDPRADYPASSSGLPSPCFELVSADGHGYRLHFTAAMDGEVALADGSTLALGDLPPRGLASLDPARRAWTWPLSDGCRCQVRWGATTFLIAPTRASQDLAPERLPRRALAALATPLSASILGTAAVVSAFLLLLEGRPTESDQLETESLSDARHKWVRELQASAKKERVVPRPETRRPPPARLGVVRRVSRVPARPSHQVDERLRVQSNGQGSPSAASERSSSRATGRDTGIVSALRASSTQLASLFGRHAAVSQDAEDALSAITGYDTYGSGDPLAGLGEGGRGGGSRGAGGVSPCGALCAFGRDPFGGLGPGGITGGVPIGPGIPPRKLREPQVFQPGRADVIEGIDADTIQRIIRRQLGQIRYCYQAVGLPTNPRLQGELRVAFLIGSTGKVLKAELASSSLGNAPTEQCVLGQIRTWRFPKTGGRTAYVVYPFRFRPAGAS